MINFEKHIQTIHFIETTIGTKHLKISQKCALESAKKYHPYANIILWSLENKLVDDYIENRIIDCKNLQLNESQILYMCKYIPIIENGGLLLYSRMLIRKEFKLSYVSCRMEFARMANGNLSNLYIYSREASLEVFEYNPYNYSLVCMYDNLLFFDSMNSNNNNSYICSKESENVTLPSDNIGVVLSNRCIAHKKSLYIKLAREVCPLTSKLIKRKDKVVSSSSTDKYYRLLYYLSSRFL